MEIDGIIKEIGGQQCIWKYLSIVFFQKFSNAKLKPEFSDLIFWLKTNPVLSDSVFCSDILVKMIFSIDASL